MPRRRSISSSKVEDFEPRKKNPLGLLDDANLDAHLKSIKIGDKLAPILISDDEIRFNADFSLDGKFKLHTLETDNQYLSLVVNGGGGGTDITYIEMKADYLVHRTKTGTYPRETYNAIGHIYQYTRGSIYSYAQSGHYVFNYWNYPLNQTRSFVEFNAGAGGIKIYSSDDDDDILTISCGADGASTISTVDDAGSDAHLTLAPDGRINLAPATGRMLFYDSDNSDDYADIRIDSNGALTINTVDAAAAAAHLTLEPDGDLILDPASQKVIINATDALYLDGGGNTYIGEASADVVRYVVGGDVMMQMTEDANAGNNTYFTNSCVTFQQLEPTYNATTTAVDFRHSNKQLVTFDGGNITNLAFYFPENSGNFVLLLKQDGTGSRTVTNWKSFEYDESAADGAAAVKFAGGSNPTLTTAANHFDIISIYWDGDNEIAYAVASLDFQD